MSIFSLMRYLAREYLLIVSTSSSESALPRLVAKMEHLGVSRPVVGITVPTGYSFNLDGTAIYLTMASLFIAEAMGTPLSIGEQISLLLFMIIASKGAAGVTGAGLAALAGGLRAPPRPGRRRRADRRHRPVHVRGPRGHQLLRQRGGHGADRQVGRRVRPGAGQPRAQRRGPVRRGDHDRRRGAAGAARTRAARAPRVAAHPAAREHTAPDAQLDPRRVLGARHDKGKRQPHARRSGSGGDPRVARRVRLGAGVRGGGPGGVPARGADRRGPPQRRAGAVLGEHAVPEHDPAAPGAAAPG